MVVNPAPSTQTRTASLLVVIKRHCLCNFTAAARTVQRWKKKLGAHLGSSCQTLFFLRSSRATAK